MEKEIVIKRFSGTIETATSNQEIKSLSDVVMRGFHSSNDSLDRLQHWCVVCVYLESYNHHSSSFLTAHHPIKPPRRINNKLFVKNVTHFARLMLLPLTHLQSSGRHRCPASVCVRVCADHRSNKLILWERWKDISTYVCMWRGKVAEIVKRNRTISNLLSKQVIPNYSKAKDDRLFASDQTKQPIKYKLNQ